MPRPFNSDLVLEEKISEATLRAYYVGYDQNIFRLNDLIEIICNVIPDFAFGLHKGEYFKNNEFVRRVRDAAKKIYDTDKYKNRGEFGELILHLILRDWCDTIPLISKIFFRDSKNIPAHGFDGVHCTIHDKKLWLGESKIYTNGKDGIKDLTKDLKTHFNVDYLKSEFSLLIDKIPDNIPEKEHWEKLMNPNMRLDTIFNSIVVPMICTYPADFYNHHTDNTIECIDDFLNECRELEKSFNDKKITTNLEVILFLLPIKNKNDLIDGIHNKLIHMQNI